LQNTRAHAEEDHPPGINLSAPSFVNECANDMADLADKYQDRKEQLGYAYNVQ